MEADKKTKVRYSKKFQVQRLDPQATKEAPNELLGGTLQYQTTKGNYEMDSWFNHDGFPSSAIKKRKNFI